MRFRIIQALCLTAIFPACNLYAGDIVQINVTGNIVASPCHIDASNMTQTINLGDELQTSALNSPSSATAWKDFSIKLTDCPAGTSQVVAVFHGTPDEEDPSFYKNAGTSKNLAVELDSQGGAHILKDGFTLNSPINNGLAEYKLSTRARTKSGGVTPGTISTTITVDFSYN